MGYSPWGHKELDTTEQLHTHTHLVYNNMSNIFSSKIQIDHRADPSSGWLIYSGRPIIYNSNLSVSHNTWLMES